MIGKAAKCLIILPKLETLNIDNAQYISNLTRSFHALVTYLKYKEVKAQLLTTDETALELFPKYKDWIMSSTPEDANFLKQNCRDMLNMPVGERNENIFLKAREKYPIERGLTTDERFAVAVKRCKLIEKCLVNENSLIFDWGLKNNPRIKVVPKDNDGKFIFRVNPLNFIVTCSISGTPTDISFLVKEFNALMPLYDWRVDKCLITT